MTQGLDALLDRIAGWTPPGLVGIVLVGSWARSTAGPGSDIDLVIVVDDQQALLGDHGWIARFNPAGPVTREDWGLVQSLRFRTGSGDEIEAGIADPRWLAAIGADPATTAVVRAGYRLLADPSGQVAAALARLDDATTVVPAPFDDY